MGTNSYITKLKAQLDQAIIQREHWKQLAEDRNRILVTEVCPESRSVEEYIIDADSVRASWRLIRGYREQIEALRAENERLRQQVVTLQSDANSWQSGYDKGREYGAKAAKGWKAQHARDSTELRRLCAERDALHAEAEALRAENARLRAVLAEQEAFVWMRPDGDESFELTREGDNLSFPLYRAPQPGPDVRGLVSADDVRDACANAVSVFAEEANADQCREAVEYMREVLLAQIARRQAQRQ